MERRDAPRCTHAPDGQVQCSDIGGGGGHVSLKGLTIPGVVTIASPTAPSGSIPTSGTAAVRDVLPLAASIVQLVNQAQQAVTELAKDKSPEPQEVTTVIGLLARTYPKLQQLAQRAPMIDTTTLPPSAKGPFEGLTSALPQLLQSTQTSITTLAGTIKDPKKVDPAGIHKAAGLLAQGGTVPNLVSSAVMPIAAWKPSQTGSARPKTTSKTKPYASGEKQTSSKGEHSSHATNSNNPEHQSAHKQTKSQSQHPQSLSGNQKTTAKDQQKPSSSSMKGPEVEKLSCGHGTITLASPTAPFEWHGTTVSDCFTIPSPSLGSSQHTPLPEIGAAAIVAVVPLAQQASNSVRAAAKEIGRLAGQSSASSRGLSGLAG